MQVLTPIQISGSPDEIYDKLYIVVNEMLYIHKVHEQKYFKAEEYAGIPIKKAWIKLTQDYLTTLKEKLIPLLSQQAVRKLVFSLKSVRNNQKVLEQSFEIIADETSIIEVLQQVYNNGYSTELGVDKLVFDIQVTITNNVQLDQDWCVIK